MAAKTTKEAFSELPEFQSTDMDPRLEDFLRRMFKIFNRFMLLMWRLGLGGWFRYPRLGGQIMVILHVGRKSGRQRQTPVNFAIVDGELCCTAGFGHTADWYRNTRVQPKVEVWMPHGRWMGEVEDITDSEDYAHLMREVLIGSGFAARLAGINPHAMDDDALIAATRGYRLLHIRRMRAATGPGGPADLAWIWPAATFLLILWMWRPFRRKN
jgi:deazaflavin-dependent oxidoreductase (nitroreductase family)